MTQKTHPCHLISASRANSVNYYSYSDESLYYFEQCVQHTHYVVYTISSDRQRKTPQKTKPGKFGRKTDKYAVDAVWTEQTIIATLQM